jgi:CheY-like chemotaxis protein
MHGSTAATPTNSDPVVLVVDDLALVREVLRAGLRCYGFEVRLAGDGAEAIELYRRDREAIAIVLLDVQMPGLDGPGVLTALRAIEPDVRAFFMTGDPGRYGEDDLLATGARRVFAKPLDIAEVVAELRQSLGAADREEPAVAHQPG